MTSGGPVVEARGLVKRFGRVRALQGLGLSVETGQCVAILGANGAGKSTLLRIVAGLLRPNQGDVLFRGESVRASGAALRRQLGYVSHHSMLYDSLSPLENLAFAGRLHGIASLKTRIDQLLRSLGLTARARDPVGTLSRGLQQRVALARALVHDPTLLLMDEPFTGLDRRAADVLQGLLASVRRRDRTVLLVTHDVGRGLAVATRAVVLDAGRVGADETLGSDAERRAFEEDYARRLTGQLATAAPAGEAS